MSAAPALHAFQQAFAAHVRDPRRTSRPAGIPARRMRVYDELVFNNLRGFLDACFPVSRSVLGERRWMRLARAFLAGWRAKTPYFREIPREFLRWLMEGDLPCALPPWQMELAHYEWAELAVDVMDVVLPVEADPAGDLLLSRPIVNPALMNLRYCWPVQRIGPGYRPRKQHPTQLLVYRQVDGCVSFIETNAVTARLVALLQSGRLTGHEALRQIAEEMVHPEPDALIGHGLAQMDALRQSEIILGVKS